MRINIKRIITILNSELEIPSSELINIAKGKYQLPMSLKGIGNWYKLNKYNNGN